MCRRDDGIKQYFESLFYLEIVPDYVGYSVTEADEFFQTLGDYDKNSSQ